MFFSQLVSNNNHDMFLHCLSSKPSENSGVQPVIRHRCLRVWSAGIPFLERTVPWRM